MNNQYLSGNNTGFSQNTPEGASTMQEEKTQVESFNNILLIEDNPGDARLVELLLGESDLLNCRITTKTTLADGMEALENDEFAAILLDLTLPDSRGFETLERLLEKHPDHNVIVLTGLSDKTLGVNSVKAGAQDFLIKGAFDSDLLAKSLRYSIERNSVLKRLEETQRIAHIGNWIFKPAAKEFTASDEIYRIFGVAPRKTVYSLDDIQSPNCPFHIFVALHEEALQQGGLKKDIEVKSEDGELRFVSVQCSINQTGGNELTLNGIFQDITDRKLAEMEMVKSQERYQDIFTKSKDSIYICNFDGKFIDFNQATAELFGFISEELKEVDIHQHYQPVEVREDFLRQLKETKAVKDIEMQILRKEGDIRHCLVTASVQEGGDFYGYNVVIRDITEHKQAEELRKARDVARQSAKMKEQFIASISHEMRTPMNAILGMSNLVIKTELDQEQYSYIHSIKQSSEILLGIINDILEISTLQNGKVLFEYKPFHLPQLLDNLVNVMRYKIKEKELDFHLDFEEGIPEVMVGDKLRLNQILYNLVGNAVKFTDSGFVRVRIKKLSENEGKFKLRFEVQDSGIGIPIEKIGAIFDTFTRVRTKDRIFEGTGLGLSIAKNLVEQQGGFINASSEPGIGSTFFFELDFEQGVLGEEEINASGEKAEDDINVDRGIKLLLVEDHKMNQLVARKTLQKQWANIDITIADHGKMAVEILEKEIFDIILMDIQMPIMDGYETTQYIRNQMPPETAQIPILAMTAHAHISKDEKFREYGMDDFVLKPFEPKQLFQKIVKYATRNNNPDE